MKEIRLITILGGGALAMYLANGSQYSTSPFDGIVWLLILITGIIIVLCTLIMDIKDYRITMSWKNFLPSVLCIAVILALVGFSMKTDRAFEKPSLLNVFYNGSYNDRGIDFKIDGTYIMDNKAIGFVHCAYGTYSLDSNRIILRPTTKGSKHNIRYMTILESKNQDDTYVLETDSTGQTIDTYVKYRIRIDNRK